MTVTGVWTRFSRTYTIANAGAKRTNMHLIRTTPLNEVVDFTLRIRATQLEYSASATAFIPTYGVASGADLSAGGAVTSTAGVAGAGSVGTVFAAGGASASVAIVGVSGAGQVGSASAIGSAIASISGAAGAGNAGAVAVVGNAITGITGVSGLGQAGTLAASTNATVAISGVAGTGQASALSGRADVSIGVSGVAGSGQAGSPTYSASAAKFIAGAFGTGAAGTVVADAAIFGWPLPSQVLAGVMYGPTGTEYVGTYVDKIRLELETGRLAKPIGASLSILL